MRCLVTVSQKRKCYVKGRVRGEHDSSIKPPDHNIMGKKEQGKQDDQMQTPSLTRVVMSN